MNYFKVESPRNASNSWKGRLSSPHQASWASCPPCAVSSSTRVHVIYDLRFQALFLLDFFGAPTAIRQGNYMLTCSLHTPSVISEHDHCAERPDLRGSDRPADIPGPPGLSPRWSEARGLSAGMSTPPHSVCLGLPLFWAHTSHQPDALTWRLS